MVKKLSEPKIIEIKNPKNGVVYLYQDQFYWNQEKQQTRHRRLCIGKLDPSTGERIFNQRYLAHRDQAEQVSRMPVIACKPEGTWLLLDKVFTTSKLKKRLSSICSPEELSRIRALVFYLVSEDNQLSKAPSWLDAHCPEKMHLTVKDMQNTLKLVNTDAQYQFFKRWFSEKKGETYQLFDLTSVASYESHNPYLHYGFNRDREALEQNNIAILTNRKTQKPLCYSLLGGNLRSLDTVEALTSHVSLHDFNRTNLVLNRIFYTREKIHKLSEKQYPFLIRIPSRQKWVDMLISKHKEEIHQAKPFFDEEGNKIQAVSIPQEHDCVIHLYYDAIWRGEQKRNLKNLLFACRQELQENQIVEEHQRLYEEYFEVKYSNRTIAKVTFRKDPSKVFEDSNTGYYAILTKGEEDYQKALATYLKRNELEREWDDLKNEKDCKMLEVHDPYLFSGRVFLQFLSLILSTYMDTILKDNQWTMGYKEVLSHMERYQRISFSKLLEERYTVPDENQIAIARLFKLKLKQ
ncbi:MAG: hypothetical protein PHO09_03625 [Sphaerochaeta sp.]|nr:hypothetical protein [Sphaerochaeta sp.]